MGRYSGKSCRLLTMLGLTASFFLVEIVTGYVTNSLALVGDSYHMLSDVVALLIGFASVRISKWRSQKNTYGWARAEVLGALVNAVFLIALCFTIFVEAIQRLTHDDIIEKPDLMLIVGGLGLGVNIIGLILFHNQSIGHGHSHGGGGGHGHGHGHSHNHSNSSSPESTNKLKGSPKVKPVNNSNCKESLSDNDDSENEDDLAVMDIDVEMVGMKPKISSSAQMNMRGVFLHVLGDALGSVVVIASALIIKYVDASWKYKVDPAMSMIMVIIILCTTIPLLKESSLILLQTVPTHIQVQRLQKKLVEKVEGVLAVHEFHIWQLAGNRIIASAHIRCQNLRDYMRIAEEVKNFFHDEGIHSTTIQPEFVETILGSQHFECLLDCCSDSCSDLRCCKKDFKQVGRSPYLRPRQIGPGTDLWLEVERERHGSGPGHALGILGEDPMVTGLDRGSYSNVSRREGCEKSETEPLMLEKEQFNVQGHDPIEGHDLSNAQGHDRGKVQGQDARGLSPNDDTYPSVDSTNDSRSKSGTPDPSRDSSRSNSPSRPASTTAPNTVTFSESANRTQFVDRSAARDGSISSLVDDSEGLDKAIKRLSRDLQELRGGDDSSDDIPMADTSTEDNDVKSV